MSYILRFLQNILNKYKIFDSVGRIDYLESVNQCCESVHLETI